MYDVDDDDFDDIHVEAVSEQSPSGQEECLYGLCGLLVYEQRIDGLQAAHVQWWTAEGQLQERDQHA